MIVSYDVSCFERELQVKFPDECKACIGAIWGVLDDAYDKWHAYEHATFNGKTVYVDDSCCEEFMMEVLTLVFPEWEEWTSVYYGDDPEEMEEDIYWISNNKKGDK
jgi:hypothetical protein